MEDTVIKLYPVHSELSEISDLIVTKNNYSDFEIRDIDLSNTNQYTLTIEKDQEKKYDYEIQANANKFRVEIESKSFLTYTSKKPFKATLKNSSDIIACGIFYRYHEKPKRSHSWDQNFDPKRHRNHIQKSLLTSNTPKLNNTIEAKDMVKNVRPKKEKTPSNYKSKEDPQLNSNKIEINFYSFVLNINCNEIKNDNENKKYDIKNEENGNITNRAILYLKKIAVKKIAHFKINLKDEIENIAELNKYLVRLLNKGICVKIDDIEEKFCYIGSSNSGRKESNFWAIDIDSYRKLNFDHFLNFFGNFSKFSDIQKLNKRYSLLYTSSIPVIEIKRINYKIVEDLNRNDFCFTDGIGIIRMKFCEEISQRLQLGYTSYIFQIRMGGFKGVLTGFSDEIFDQICPGVKDDVKILFRKSQEKFESHNFELNIVSWATNESVPASLNSEVLMILDGLCGKKFKDYVLRLFDEFLTELEKSLVCPKKAVAKMFYSDIVNEFVHKFKMILLACRENMENELEPKHYKIIRELLIEQNLYNLITKRTFNIKLEKSRFVIGVIDESSTLEEDQVFVSFRNSLGNIEYLDSINVVICRFPCYSVTEARKVRTRYVDKLSHLENCIVFPKKGNRPLVDILSGGDLDGDLYFVSWDEHLSNFENSNKLMDYPKSKVASTSIDKTNLLNQLIQVYVDDVTNKDNIGLWHYFLLCSYDQDRKNMLKKDYLNGVLEINKCIDGIKSSEKPSILKKPLWYISSRDLKKFESREQKINGKEIPKEKNILKEFLKEIINKIDINTQEDSLIACLAKKAIKNYYDLVNSNMNLKGEFLNSEEINLLKKYDFIFDLSSEEKNLKQIKEKYIKYIKDLEKIDNSIQIQKTKCDLFKGMAVRQLSKNNCSELEELKAKYTEEYRKFVIDLDYHFDVKISDQNLKKSKHSMNGLYFRSRVIYLYETLKNDNIFYQIPWMFYDVLCLMKNFCNDKLSDKFSKVLPNLVPFSIPANCTSTFSAKKLSNFNENYQKK